jgi:hypothetical protein
LDSMNQSGLEGGHLSINKIRLDD